MKTRLYLSTICLLSVSVFLLWAKFEVTRNFTSVSVIEDADTYLFTATYKADKARRVYNYINTSIRPVQLGNSENDYVDVTTVLSDKTQFYVKESSGKVKIKFDKWKNSRASYIRVKRMCDGIKAILAAK